MSNYCPKVLVAYADLIDGVRSWYARREGNDWVAGFSAALLLSLLLLFNLSTLTMLADITMHGTLRVASWVRANRALATVGMLSVAAAHIFFAKRMGVYNGPLEPRTESWARRMRLYIVCTCIFFVMTMLLIALESQSTP